MPSPLEWFYGFCAASLIGYLVGWPISAVGGDGLRRARLFAAGGVASVIVLVVSGWPLFAVFVLSAVGAGLAVGFREAVQTSPAVRQRLASIRPSFRPAALSKAMQDVERLPADPPVPELAPLVRFDERPTTEQVRPEAKAQRPQKKKKPIPPPPPPRRGAPPPPLPQQKHIPPKEPTAQGMLGPLNAPDTIHGAGTSGYLGPLEPNSSDTTGQIRCNRCGATNSYTAAFCVQCNAAL